MDYNTLTFNLTNINRNKKSEFFLFIAEFSVHVTIKLKVLADEASKKQKIIDNLSKNVRSQKGQKLGKERENTEY